MRARRARARTTWFGIGVMLVTTLVLASCGGGNGTSTATATIASVPATLVPSPASTPAPPTTVGISGVIPNLLTPVPVGEGEQGRITVTWGDSSDNEDGFRIYNDCGGTISRLAEAAANETQFGPLQSCRPGRVGVAAFNSAGESEIVWSIVSPSPADTTPSAAAPPAAPTMVVLTGVIPDLRTPVPLGQGELGRITVTWVDSSADETGFRVFQECGGTVSQLGETGANETQLGPLQPCRPGRVGVAAFGPNGVSAITFSP